MVSPARQSSFTKHFKHSESWKLLQAAGVPQSEEHHFMIESSGLSNQKTGSVSLLRAANHITQFEAPITQHSGYCTSTATPSATWTRFRSLCLITPRQGSLGQENHSVGCLRGLPGHTHTHPHRFRQTPEPNILVGQSERESCMSVWRLPRAHNSLLCGPSIHVVNMKYSMAGERHLLDKSRKTLQRHLLDKNV